MSYSFETEKKNLRSDAGQLAIVATAFRAKDACAVAGAVTMAALISGMVGVSDSWGQLAVVDRLCEIGYLREVRQAGDVAGQHRIFRWVGP